MDMPRERRSLRDSLVLVSAAVIVIAGYLVVKSPSSMESPLPPEPDAQVMDNDDAMQSLTGLPESYDELVPMGNKLMDEGNFPMAAECYRRALAIWDNADVRVDFGACLHGMGLGKRAIEEFMKVVAESPDHAIANFNIGIVYQSLRQPDSARSYYQRYLDIAPDGAAAATARKLLDEL